MTQLQQSSFSAVVRSPAAPPRGAFGLLVFALRLITFEADLTVSQLRNPNYEGSVNYLRIILENGKIASEIPEVPAERYDELHCATTEQLKLYERPAATSAAPSPGNFSLRAANIAGAPRIDRQWAYNGTTCARLGSGKI